MQPRGMDRKDEVHTLPSKQRMDRLPWEGNHGSSWGAWSDNYNDNSERLRMVECLSGSILFCGAKLSGEKKCCADVFY